ncbi:C2 family cysteine protease [Legionella spiritensis]|uniref:Coiled-coil protein n=1 Tax=Legionella spiritensis TaxID=452 RepID=A0A0W0YXH7_LEGSP|nr:C2 family cysteine protease [Legionella spiritensis]KTD61585.1 coiled-coil protein [Legionella spiritensis]SNV32318.1 coiled-coil protein [Legionella spiritensis]
MGRHEQKNPTGSYLGFTVHHQKYNASLFPEKLLIQQVAQGGRSGDCYLLSVINAILAQPEGEAFIRRHMIEKDGKIHVLLFHQDEPQWVVLDKALPTSWGILSSGAAWVRFLEKAYVAFKTGNYNKTLKSGDSREALKTLLGGSSDYIATSAQSRSPLHSLYKKSIDGCSGTDIYALVFLLRPNDRKASVGNMVEHIFKGDKQLLQQWWAWVAKDRQGWEKLLSANPVLLEETFVNHLKKKEESGQPSDYPHEAAAAVCDWLREQAILPSAKRYSNDELELFSNLQEAFQNQQPIVASPKETPPSGITIQHTYAITGFRESEVTHRKFVVLRNPHHENRSWLSHLFLSGGRQASEIVDPLTGQVKFTISATKNATFEMELRDFSHAFAHIDAGTALDKVKFVQEMDEEESPTPVNKL